jgi:hypothetical protein
VTVEVHFVCSCGTAGTAFVRTAPEGVAAVECDGCGAPVTVDVQKTSPGVYTPPNRDADDEPQQADDGEATRAAGFRFRYANQGLVG